MGLTCELFLYNAGVPLDDLIMLDTKIKKWIQLSPAGVKPSARYDMSLIMGSHNKIVMVGGKLSAWSGTASEYSWSSVVPPSINTEYSTDKGNDEVWELDMMDTTWKLRVPSLYAQVCAGKEEVKPGTPAATFCDDYIGLSGTGLSSAADGYLYMVGGNAVFLKAAPEIFSFTGGMPSMPSDEVCIKPEPEPTWYYANFVKIDPRAEEIIPQFLTATSTAATASCAETDVACRQYYGPEPARISSSFDLQSDPATGMMFLLHPDTGDWWQYDTSTQTKWLLNNGIVEGRSVTATPTAPTSFFASTYVEATGKFIVCGGGYRDANSWGNQCPEQDMGLDGFTPGEDCKEGPLTNPFALTVEGSGKFMELDLESARFTDLDSLAIVEVLPGGACTVAEKCVPQVAERLFAAAFCEYATQDAIYGVCKYSRTATTSIDNCEEVYAGNIKSIQSCQDSQTSVPMKNIPTYRYGHGMVEIGNSGGDILVFGGTTGNIDHAQGSRPKQWVTAGDMPKVATFDNRELIQGNFAGVKYAKNDLFLHSPNIPGPNNGEWVPLDVGLTKPAARSFSGFSSLPHTDTSFLLFGGFTVKRLPELSDTWRLTITRAYALNGYTYVGSWTYLETNGPSPSGRMGHGMVSNNFDGKIHLFGGGYVLIRVLNVVICARTCVFFYLYVTTSVPICVSRKCPYICVEHVCPPVPRRHENMLRR